jgi:hypothetical protein
MIELTDDGTMDTVLRCSKCQQEFRFNYDGGMDAGTDDDQPEREQDALAAYDAWVDSIIEDTESEHECREVR